jgi:hypothetical protein
LRRRNGPAKPDELAIAKLLSLSRRPVINLRKSCVDVFAGRTAFFKATEGSTQVLDHLSDAEIVRWRDRLAALEELLRVNEHLLSVFALPQTPDGSL